MPGPRVTVVIPTRNRASWLRTCLESVLAQRSVDLVVLVADNASTDDTQDVVASFSDDRIRSVRRRENVGLLANFVQAAHEVDTDYVLLLGDDDVLHPDLLATSTGLLDAHPQLGMVHTAFDLVGPDGQLLRPDVNWTGGLTTDTVESGATFRRETMRHSCRVCSSTAVLRTRLGQQVGWFRAADLPPIDLGMWLRFSLLADVAFVARSLVSYRIHPASHSAELGPVVEDGYVLGPDLIDRVYEVKCAFVEANRAELPDAAHLLALARQRRNEELLLYVRRRTLPGRRFGATTSLLTAMVRRSPSLAAQGDTWKLLGGSLIGPDLVERVKARRADVVAGAGGQR